MTIPKSLPVGLIDSLLADYKKPEDLIGENGLLKQLRCNSKVDYVIAGDITLLSQ